MSITAMPAAALQSSLSIRHMDCVVKLVLLCVVNHPSMHLEVLHTTMRQAEPLKKKKNCAISRVWPNRWIWIWWLSRFGEPLPVFSLCCGVLYPSWAPASLTKTRRSWRGTESSPPPRQQGYGSFHFLIASISQQLRRRHRSTRGSAAPTRTGPPRQM